jgi:hypothetical protein
MLTGVKMKFPIDAYDLQARYAPAVFTISPLLIVALAAIPSLAETKVASGSLAAVAILAFGFVAIGVARAAGHARQDKLFASWGGMPTTAMLRFRDDRLNPRTKQIYRDRLSHLGPNFPIPDEEEEKRDPIGADVKIGATMDEVRGRAKKKEVKTVHRENINYGAARNAFGLKPYGLGTCVLAVITIGVEIALRDSKRPTSFDVVELLAILAIGGTWVFAFTPKRIRHHPEAYALALFEAIVSLVPAGKSTAKTPRGSKNTPSTSAKCPT